jgi:phage tail-like protein
MSAPNSLGNTTPTNFYQNFFFIVSVDNVKYGAFSECVLPSLSVKTEDVQEGGQNAYLHKLPISVDIGTFTLKRGLTRDLFFLKWYMQVMEGNIQGATRQVAVLLVNPDGSVITTWSFANAYPIKWRGPSMKSSESAIAIEEIEFAHHGFEVQEATS